MPTNQNLVNFSFGSYNSYNNLQTKDPNTLYFVDGIIYKGSVPYSKKIEILNSQTRPVNPVLGKIYVYPDYQMEYYDGTNWNIIQLGRVTTIDGTTITNDSLLVTQGAVKTYVQQELDNFDNEEMVDAKIRQAIASVFRFKGSKANFAAVEALEESENEADLPIVGDVWHTTDTGKEYVCTGTDPYTWELLGFTIDLSSYATISYVDTEVGAVQTALTTHTSNTDIHITAAERTKWNDAESALTWKNLDSV